MNPENMAKDMAEVKAQVKEIYTALCGDPISKDGGLVRRIDNIEMKQEMQDAKLSKAARAISRVGLHVKIMWGAGGAVIMAIYSLIIKK